jgi:predicted  nucleic acid-binding Zn-ribbon protein
LRPHPELETLLEIQDLRALRRDLGASGRARDATAVGSDDVEHAARIEERIAERERRLSPAVRSAYQRLSIRHERVVAPVLDGVCHGCFVQVPTSRDRDSGRHSEIRTCESCGRFLYYAD